MKKRGIVEFCAQDRPDFEPIILTDGKEKPWLQLGEIILLYAPRGVGKSFVAMMLAHGAATGGMFLKWKCSRKFKVLYNECEMPGKLVSDRFMMIDRGSADSVDSKYLQLLTREEMGRNWNMASFEDQAGYDREFQDREIIIIDNLTNAMFAESSKDSEFDQYQRAKQLLFSLRDAGKTVILIHHAGKSGQQLGTSIKENDVDTMLRLQSSRLKGNPEATSIELHFEKTRRVAGKPPGPFFVEYADVDNSIAFNVKELDDLKLQQIPDLLQRLGNRDLVAKCLDIPAYEVAHFLSLAEEGNKKWALPIDAF
jgi:archaellum biogenesis ATPase FlaH